jgi:hypothetical protein
MTTFACLPCIGPSSKRPITCASLRARITDLSPLRTALRWHTQSSQHVKTEVHWLRSVTAGRAQSLAVDIPRTQVRLGLPAQAWTTLNQRIADTCTVSKSPSQLSLHTAARHDGHSCLPVAVCAAGVATAMVGRKHDGSYDEHTVIHIIKKGTVSLVSVPESTEPNTLPWGIGSAAQVCGDQMWFAVPMPAEGLGEGAPQVWYSSWITWQQL